MVSNHHLGHLEGEQPQLGDLLTLVINPLTKWDDPPSKGKGSFGNSNVYFGAIEKRMYPHVGRDTSCNQVSIVGFPAHPLLKGHESLGKLEGRDNFLWSFSEIPKKIIAKATEIPKRLARIYLEDHPS